MRQLIEEGHIKHVIARRYPLIEIAEASRYYKTGHPPGKVVLTIMEELAE